MSDMTDEDKMIERLIIHRNMIGWVIEKLQEEVLKQREQQETTLVVIFW